MIDATSRLVVLAPSPTPATAALLEAARAAAGASELTVTDSPLQALWTLAAGPARGLLMDVRCLAFREREIIAAARAASPAARLVVMAQHADEVHLAALATAVDELAVGPAEVRRSVQRLLAPANGRTRKTANDAGRQHGTSGESLGQNASADDELAGAINHAALLTASIDCLRQMADRPAAESPEAIAAMLSQALLTMPGLEAAAFLTLPPPTPATPATPAPASTAHLLALSGTGLSIDEALAAQRVNGDRAWSSAGRRRWLMPIDMQDGPHLGLLVLLAEGVDEAATLDALHTPALIAATRLEAARQRAAAVRLMTLDPDTRLHRRGYLEPYIDALCRGARQRRREVLLVVIKLVSPAAQSSPAAALREIGLWAAETLPEARVGRWDDRTVVAAAPARDVQHIQLAQKLLQRAGAKLGRSAEMATAVFPWDGENAAALVKAAADELT